MSHYRGYTVQVSENVVLIDLFIEPQMFDLKGSKGNTINQVMYDQYQTKMVLESVFWSEDKDYLIFNFRSDFDLAFQMGNFYIAVFSKRVVG